MSINYSKCIWVIDDDGGILEVTQIVLEEEGYTTLIIQNEKEIREALHATHSPSVILLDVLMSGVDGRDIAHQLKQHKLTQMTPIIMMSADTHLEEKAKEAQADDYLKKPFDIEQLINKVKKWGI